jgi:hypothetical protein
MLPAAAWKDESVAELVAKAEAADLNHQAELYVEIAEKQLKAAKRLYDDNKFEEARVAVEDIRTYSEKGTDAAIKSGKRLKKTEIALRKMADKLDDLKRSLPFDDQAPAQATASRLQELRTQLLDRMFNSKGKKK